MHACTLGKRTLYHTSMYPQLLIMSSCNIYIIFSCTRHFCYHQVIQAPSYFIRLQAIMTSTRLTIQRILTVSFRLRWWAGYTESPSKMAAASAHWHPDLALKRSAPFKPDNSASPFNTRRQKLRSVGDSLKRVAGTTITLSISLEEVGSDFGTR
jgi:hypothetical protein